MKKWLFLFVLLLVTSFVFVNSASITKPVFFSKTVSFDCPQIDDKDMVSTPASSCMGLDGSITNIKGIGGNGTLKFAWYNAEKDKIRETADLIGVAPGTYTLKLTDESKCAAAIKSYTVKANDAVIIDTSEIKYIPSLCTKNTGAIKGIAIKNAVKIQWFDSGNTEIGSTPDLTDVASGVYNLVATNANGCSATGSFVVPSSVYFPSPIKIDTAIGICNDYTGSLTLTFNLNPTDPVYDYAVIDAYGNVADGDNGPITGTLSYGDGSPIKITFPIGAPNSLYTFRLTDQNNYCPNIVGRYSLPQPVFKIDTSKVRIKNDACGKHTGGIFHLKTIGGTKPTLPLPQQWYWTDSLGNSIGRLPDLTDVGKGTYHVLVTDVHGCSDSQTFTLTDSTGHASPPALNNITLCLPATTTLSVINPDTKLKYRLYDSMQTPVTENNYGIFQKFVSKTTRYYVTTVDSLCESDMTPVMVTVIAPGVIIPNTFTPNNDGINDTWNIPHINEFPGAEVTLFNREGYLVYHSIDYSHPFDGKLNGRKLPIGVYYYIIDLKQPECLGKVSGNLTIIR